MSYIIRYLADLDVYHYCDTTNAIYRMVDLVHLYDDPSTSCLLPHSCGTTIYSPQNISSTMGYSNRSVPGNLHMVHVPSLGDCAIILNGTAELGPLLLVSAHVLSFLLVIISAVYLFHKIIHVKAYTRQSGLDQRKLNRSQGLKELLTEQVKLRQNTAESFC